MSKAPGPTCKRPDCRSPRSCVHPIRPPHQHAFYLTHTYTGAESGQRVFVGTCICGATEHNTDHTR